MALAAGRAMRGFWAGVRSRDDRVGLHVRAFIVGESAVRAFFWSVIVVVSLS